MTTVTVELSETLQAVIDTRLDTIDRILLGRLPRADRTAIVREVELQIHEQLQERTQGEPDRQDILAVLARLDPPEAYIPDDSESGIASIRNVPTSAGRTSSLKNELKVSRLSGILGITCLVCACLSPLSWVLANAFGSEVLLIGLAAGALMVISATSTLALVLGGYSRLRSAWAWVGVVGSLLGLFVVAVEVVFFCVLAMG